MPLFALLLLLVSYTYAYPISKDAIDRLALSGLVKLERYLAQNPASGGCTLKTAAKRSEWGDLSIRQREDYVNAVLCLQSLPPISDNVTVPGARSRFDDFVAVHIKMSGSIHATANFLTWHRYFTWAYEKALREECGYTGYQPYWNWGRYALDPINSPIFNGDAASMSGNGVYSEYPGLLLPLYEAPYNIVPPDQGGGCVTTGPFKDMKVNLGPVFAGLPDVPPNPQADGLGYNPRCLRRDVNKNAAAATTSNWTQYLIEQSNNVYWFQTIMNGRAERGEWGVHTAGHFTIGGDPGGDFFVSPGDPAFYLHHGMIDRVYWIWQLQNLPARLHDVSGTITPANSPPSRNGTLDDELDLGLLAEKLRLGDALKTMGGLDGQFCYIYN
ncbi:tyrosinase central domain-containing protein [Pseudomassariella vexata]|uniref:Tyrosinase central domain-containing protein n=1 Tax=Pseudomassariella vexata TaxID=1141098 RepID=A0A1Y2E0D0_9PEZI|nr:tyrosinase central domain-containing protein [Pseudomassariella vexata]ORY64814.1 tyrosinase central domain-containing protein [Pseudomassariella vexata]